ncbi:MAG: hypothetical protein L0210_15685 [Rhodospirillales bacterium]|nr:hypothetical protein [Rhodospirillales bacterium]
MTILASNISGANDGAGPAAAVVAAGKLAVGAAAATAFKYSGAKDLGDRAKELLGGGDRREGKGGGLPGAASRGGRAAGGRIADIARQFRERTHGDE